MRITDINIDSEQISNGLNPIKMNKLGQCVLIAGKNGSGKSRLLSMISIILSQKPTKYTILNINMQIKSNESTIVDTQRIIDGLKKEITINPSSSNRYTRIINQHERSVVKCRKQIEQLKNSMNWSLIMTDDHYEGYATVSFVPKNLNIRDCSNDGRKNLNDYAKNTYNIGIEQMQDSTFAYIQVLQDRWFNATHHKSTIPPDDKDKAINDYEKLIEIIQVFLGSGIDRDLDGFATLFGFQLAKSNLSNGQKVVLQYCIAIHAQGASLDDHILVMDEPENHLHPYILIELIENIKKYNKNGQIWIATHSVPLLSHFDPQDIWYMEDGFISKYGKVSEKVLGSLLGNDEQIEKLKDFINLPAIYAVNRYTFESLFPPKTKDTDSNDPQTRQIHSAIENYIKPDGSIKILDYGAGKGRILNCVEESKDVFLDKVEYFAFDKYSDNKEECLFSIGNLYENQETRYFNNEKELRSRHDEYSFDIVIMSNVLHEICPNEWLKLFGNNGFITKTLKKTGILLLVEDHQIPYGEKAYQNGFLVLDTPELKKLFNISSEEKGFSWDDFYEDGRLKAHRIPQPYLENVTSITRIASLNELKENAIREITELRKKDEKNYKNGRLSGFWIHQLCNVELVLIDLEGS